MNKAIKSVVVPHLRAIGFKGSFPHFYRVNIDYIDLITFQFNLNGGRFVVEMSYVDPDKNNVFIDKDVPTSKFRVSQTSKRLCLGSSSDETDNWFVFERKNIFFKPDCEKIAQKIVELMKSQGESWFQSQRVS